MCTRVEDVPCMRAQKELPPNLEKFTLDGKLDRKCDSPEIFFWPGGIGICIEIVHTTFCDPK